MRIRHNGVKVPVKIQKAKAKAHLACRGQPEQWQPVQIGPGCCFGWVEGLNVGCLAALEGECWRGILSAPGLPDDP